MERFPKHSRVAAFTIKELLLVAAVISVLLCVQLSGLTGGSNSAKIAQCAANLKQHAAVLQAYGIEHNNALPGNPYGNWPWDVAVTTINLLTNYGLTRANLYDPGFPQQNIDQQWNGYYSAGYRVTGYADMLPRSLQQSSRRVLLDDLDIALTTQGYTLNGSDPSLGPAGATVLIPPSQRVLFADATLSSQGQTDPTQAASYQWTLHTDTGVVGNAAWNVTPYGPWRGSSTPHMGAVLPLGGNVAMLDGHVQWRPFTNMLVRTSGAGDEFWW